VTLALAAAGVSVASIGVASVMIILG